MKRLSLVLALLLVLGLGAIGYWYINQPKNAAEAFEKASKEETRLHEELRLAREEDPPDTEKIALLEAEIRATWSEFVELWPDSEEADNARYRLLLIDLAAAEPGKPRLELVEAFLEAQAEHENVKDLMWRRAEIIRDEIDDPLVAVEAFEEIEAKFPDDEIAPRAALAAARIYDAIEEPAAAAKAYSELAEKYPNSPEAQQALMREAALLEEKLGRKEEAAEVYREVAEANPGSAMGRQAQGRRKRLLGEIGEGEQEEYYQQTYQQAEFANYDISQEDYNHPTRKKMREQGFDAGHYDVTVRLDPEKRELSAVTKLRGTIRKPITGPLLLELNPLLKIESITSGGEGAEPRTLNFEHKDEFLGIVVPGADAVAEGEPMTLNLTFTYKGGVETWGGGEESADALSLWGETRWFPQTQIGDMYTQAVTVEIPEGFEAVAQGERLGDTEEIDGDEDWQRARFRQMQPGQFMTLAMGRFEITRFTGPGGVPMEILVAADHEKAAESIRESMEASVRAYNEMLGRFPFDKLAVAEVPEFPGGYGSASLILMGTIIFDGAGGGPEKILAHEIAHQWFGNLLSLDLQDGSIPWLSEGFATYCDAVYTERTAGRQAFLNQIIKMGNFYRQNALLFEDRPISQTLWRNPMYRSLMYEKGALVLHELRREIGDEKFFRLLKEFVAENRFEIVRISDFAEKAAAIAGQDLDWFFEQTLDRTGYPTVEVVQALAEPTDGSEDPDAEGPWTIDLTLKQSDPAYRLKLDLAFDLADGETHVETIELSKLRLETEIETPGKPQKIRIDPDGWYLLGGGLDVKETPVRIMGEEPAPIDVVEEPAGESESTELEPAETIEEAAAEAGAEPGEAEREVSGDTEADESESAEDDSETADAEAEPAGLPSTGL